MKIGLIGCGNMGSAMARGILDAKLTKQEELIASAKSASTRERVEQELAIRMTEDNRVVAECADVLFLAVKPQYYQEVIAQIKEVIRQEQIIVSIAPGKSLQWLEDQFGVPVKLVRAMPNTPAMVKEGMTAYCVNNHVTEDEAEQVRRVFEAFGQAEEVPENLMDVATAVSGSSPAYVFLFIEAMADAAVADGMPRDKAYRMAAQAVLGSAKLMLDTGRHPGELKDMVCSPGGTTIEAVRVLEEKGLRSSVFEAMKACVRKSRGM